LKNKINNILIKPLVYENPYGTNAVNHRRQIKPSIATNPKQTRNRSVTQLKQDQTNEKPLSYSKPLAPSLSGEFLPDFGNFKQGLARPEDMDREERAVMNLYAKDYDDLKLLDMLKGNSDLYIHKLKQYKSSSKQRNDVEK
jgi:hypothetical protein